MELQRRGEQPIRIALYSHDTFGLGHLSRCLKIAGQLRRLGMVEGLVITGLPHARRFALPAGFRREILPAVGKRRNGRYAARGSGASLRRVLSERRRRIRDALAGFRPDLLVVDNVPAGLDGEILPALRRLQQARAGRAVLAVRDVLDSPEVVRREWSDPGVREALNRYDEIWVFGSPAATQTIVDAAALGGRRASVVACGQLGPLASPASARRLRRAGSRPRIVVTGGGGADAVPIARHYLDALRRFRPKVASRLVLGPDFCERTFREITSHNGFDARIERFVPRLGDQLGNADLVVSMAGYNTVCEVLAAGCASVLIPRIKPRREQWLRALSLERQQRATILRPDRLDPVTLWRAVEERLETRPPRPRQLPGASRALARAAALLGVTPPTAPLPSTH